MTYRKPAVAGALWVWAVITIAGLRTDHWHTHMFWQLPILRTLIWPLLPGIALLVYSLRKTVRAGSRRKLLIAVGLLASATTIAVVIVHHHDLKNEQNRQRRLAQLITWKAIPMPINTIPLNGDQSSDLDISSPRWDHAGLILTTFWKDWNIRYRIEIVPIAGSPTGIRPDVPSVGKPDSQKQERTTENLDPDRFAASWRRYEGVNGMMRSIADSCRFDIELFDSNGLILQTLPSVQLNPIVDSDGHVARLSGSASDLMAQEMYEDATLSRTWAAKYSCYNNILAPGVIVSNDDRSRPAR